MGVLSLNGSVQCNKEGGIIGKPNQKPTEKLQERTFGWRGGEGEVEDSDELETVFDSGVTPRASSQAAAKADSAARRSLTG